MSKEECKVSFRPKQTSDFCMEKIELLRIENLNVAFSLYQSFYHKKELQVIKDMSLHINKAELLAIVGASGSGKSVLAHAILGLLPNNASVSGNIYYEGRHLDSGSYQKKLGKEIAYIPQSVDYLDPLMRIEKQVQGVFSSAEATKAIWAELNLKAESLRKFPFELSGGMARRALIAGAMLQTPELIVADEPTPGLDVKLATEVLQKLREFADKGTAVMLITHDLDLAIEVADRVAVFYEGEILEINEATAFDASDPELSRLKHPYTKALFRALPTRDFKGQSEAELSEILEYKAEHKAKHKADERGISRHGLNCRKSEF